MNYIMPKIYLAGLFLVILNALNACSSAPNIIPLALPEPLREPVSTSYSLIDTVPLAEQEAEQATESPTESTEINSTQFGEVPRLPPMQTHQTPSGTVKSDSPSLSGQAVQINVDSLPLPAFINEVYGNVLGLSFEIEPSLQNKRDLVTLRVVEPQKPDELYQLAAQVLDNYGVGMIRQGQLLRFVPAATATSSEPPLLIQGTALPSVPSSHRPVFQFVPLKVVRNAMVRQWIAEAYRDQQLQVSEDMMRNAIILRGKPEIVAQAAEAIRILDQPLMRGRHSTTIQPAFLTAQELSQALESVLTAQGYTVGNRSSDQSPILLIPFGSNNSILVFSVDREILNFIKSWAIKLDQPKTIADDIKPQQQVFYYMPRNTTATSLSGVLSNLIADITKSVIDESVKPEHRAANKLISDDSRNVLLFYGEQNVWQQILPIIQRLDVATKQVLVEVTIAEITLSDDTKFGIEWVIKNAGIGSFAGPLSTSLALGSAGLNYLPLSGAGHTKAVLNAFATANQVKVLSTPSILVRSGQEANIKVGREVPVVTSQATAPDLQTQVGSSILQQIQYRTTGISLSVKPMVFSETQVDLEITQSSSEAQINDLSTVPSPIISNREIKTSLSLADGGSVLLGGLISNNEVTSDTGIPLLKDIPILGHLFKSQGVKTERSELIMLIIPYILSDNSQVRDITQAFKNQLSILKPEDKQTLITPTITITPVEESTPF